MMSSHLIVPSSETDEVSPTHFLSRLPELLQHTTRAQIFLELIHELPASASMLANRLSLPVQNVHYHLKLLKRAGAIVEQTSNSEKFTHKLYLVTPHLRRNFDLGQFNAQILDALPQVRRGLVAAMCASAAKQLETLSSYYKQLSPDAFDELFFIENAGIMCSFPVRLGEVAEFTTALRQLLGRYALQMSSGSEEPDGIITLAILPRP